MYRKILALLLCGMMILLVGCGKEEEKKPAEESSTVSVESKPEVIYYVNNLTGEQNMTDKDKVDDRPVAVMINNNHVAWPHAGLNDAYLAYEILAEGGITRIMALFKDKDTEKIGSVRSARPYYLDYALENDAIYVHYGWSDKAKSDISSLGVDNINGLTASSVFWRDSSLNKARISC